MKYSRPKVTEITGRPKQGACLNGSVALTNGCTVGPTAGGDETCISGNTPGVGNCYNGNSPGDGSGSCRLGLSPGADSGGRCSTGTDDS